MGSEFEQKPPLTDRLSTPEKRSDSSQLGPASDPTASAGPASQQSMQSFGSFDFSPAKGGPLPAEQMAPFNHWVDDEIAKQKDNISKIEVKIPGRYNVSPGIAELNVGKSEQDPSTMKGYCEVKFFITGPGGPKGLRLVGKGTGGGVTEDEMSEAVIRCAAASIGRRLAEEC